MTGAGKAESLRLSIRAMSHRSQQSILSQSTMVSPESSKVVGIRIFVAFKRPRVAPFPPQLNLRNWVLITDISTAAVAGVRFG